MTAISSKARAGLFIALIVLLTVMDMAAAEPWALEWSIWVVAAVLVGVQGARGDARPRWTWALFAALVFYWFAWGHWGLMLFTAWLLLVIAFLAEAWRTLAEYRARTARS